MDRRRSSRVNAQRTASGADNGNIENKPSDVWSKKKTLNSTKSSKISLKSENNAEEINGSGSSNPSNNCKHSSAESSGSDMVVTAKLMKSKMSSDLGDSICLKTLQSGERNVARHLQDLALGLSQMKHIHQHAASIVVREVKSFEVWRVTSPFQRRTTSLCWHPCNSNVVAAGSKFGDLYLWDLTTSTSSDTIIKGSGPGNVVTDLCFLRESPLLCRIAMTSMDGSVSIRDLRTSAEDILAGEKSFCSEIWPCSLSVTENSDAVVFGDSKGNVSLVTVNAEKVWSHRFHKAKVNHIEFHPSISWLLCTASTDKTVALWDLRMINSKQDSITRLTCPAAVAAASFSQTNGQRLLVTDQHHSLRVYSCGGSWDLEQDYVQPHRQFQHLTPIKASWHPLEDLIVCSRYPDPALRGQSVEDKGEQSPRDIDIVDQSLGDTRGIDIFNVNSAQRVGHLQDSSAPQISSRTLFNRDGTRLASAMGTTLLIWSRSDLEQLGSDALTSESVSMNRLLNPESSADRNNNRFDKQTNRKREKATRAEVKITKKKLKE